MTPTVDGLVARSVVRVSDGDGQAWGTGFMITPSIAATCAHVIPADRPLEVAWRGESFTGHLVETFKGSGRIFPDLKTQYPDLALVEVAAEQRIPPAYLDLSIPPPTSKLQTIGFPHRGGVADNPIPASMTTDGFSGDSEVRYLTATGGAVGPGNSGGPVFSGDPNRPYGVIGHLVATEGGSQFIVVWADLVRLLPGVRRYHSQNESAMDHHDRAIWHQVLRPASSIKAREGQIRATIERILPQLQELDSELVLTRDLSVADRQKLSRSASAFGHEEILAVSGRFKWFYFGGLAITPHSIYIGSPSLLRTNSTQITVEQLTSPTFRINTGVRYEGGGPNGGFSRVDYIEWTGGPKNGIGSRRVETLKALLERLREALREL